jgi:hypothetical protein
MVRFALKLGLVLLLLQPVACSGADSGADDPAVAEETTGDAEGALTARHHFAPTQAELSWRPGCGVRMPDGRTCYMGLELAYTKKYDDLKVAVRTTVNNTKKTITVKLDTYASEDPQGSSSDETKSLGTPRSLSHMTRYDAKVVDYQGNELWSGEIYPAPAP